MAISAGFVTRNSPGRLRHGPDRDRWDRQHHHGDVCGPPPRARAGGVAEGVPSGSRPRRCGHLEEVPGVVVGHAQPGARALLVVTDGERLPWGARVVVQRVDVSAMCRERSRRRRRERSPSRRQGRNVARSRPRAAPRRRPPTPRTSAPRAEPSHKKARTRPRSSQRSLRVRLRGGAARRSTTPTKDVAAGRATSHRDNNAQRRRRSSRKGTPEGDTAPHRRPRVTGQRRPARDSPIGTEALR